MLDRELILSLIPHQGGMCLLDAVHDWNAERIHCRTRSHQRPDNPLRSEDGLRALHLCEYGAQSMAVHGGLLARQHGGRAMPGLLVALRAVRIDRAWLHDLPEALDVFGERIMAAETSWQYGFRIEHAGQLLAEGRAAVMLAPCAARIG